MLNYINRFIIGCSVEKISVGGGKPCWFRTALLYIIWRTNNSLILFFVCHNRLCPNFTSFLSFSYPRKVHHLCEPGTYEWLKLARSFGGTCLFSGAIGFIYLPFDPECWEIIVLRVQRQIHPFEFSVWGLWCWSCHSDEFLQIFSPVRHTLSQDRQLWGSHRHPHRCLHW